MPKYILTACAETYYEIEIEAPSEERALEIGWEKDDLDDWDETTNDSWEIVHVQEVSK